jgi:hypothetical protein
MQGVGGIVLGRLRWLKVMTVKPFTETLLFCRLVVGYDGITNHDGKGTHCKRALTGGSETQVCTRCKRALTGGGTCVYAELLNLPLP